MPKRLRAISRPEQRVGAQRYALYCETWRHIESAVADEYYLEAITLIESLLADRLESRLSFLTGENHGFLTLGKLVTLFKPLEKDPQFIAVLARIDKWRVARNAALHEIAKFEMGTSTSWAEKMAPLSGIFAEGREVLLAFDALDEGDRQKSDRHAATWPNAFASP